jgi:hypothetical protein
MPEPRPTTPDVEDDVRSVVLHIGPRKTGTTAIQHALHRRRDQLRDLGVAYPGTGTQHFVLVNRFLGRRQVWDMDLESTVNEEPWHQMVKETEWASCTVLSTEVLSQARAADIARMVKTFPRHRITVVITYRPYQEIVSSTWQQLVKEGLSEPLDEWSRATVDAHPEETAQRFPRVLDLATLVRTWGSVVGTQNVAVVVVDPRQPRAVMDAFEKVIGLPSGFLEADPGSPRKRSMTAQEAELVRQVNARIPKDESTFAKYGKNRIKLLARYLEENPAAPTETRLTLPVDVFVAAVRRGQEMVQAVAGLTPSPAVFGELSDLTPDVAPPVESSETPQTVNIALAARLIAGALRASAEPDRNGSSPPRRRRSQ